MGVVRSPPHPHVSGDASSGVEFKTVGAYISDHPSQK
jgi:hypothetical protein